MYFCFQEALIMESTPIVDANTSQPVRIGWVARLVQATWKSFRAKLVAAIAFIASVTAVLTFVLNPSIPRPLRLVGAIGFSLLLVGLAIYYTATSLITLAREGERLAVELDRAWEQVRSLNLEKEEWQKEPGTPSLAARLASALYGMVYYIYNMDCTLENTGAFLIKSSLNLAATIGGIRNIEHHVTAPHAPEEWDQVIELAAEDKDDKTVLLEPVIVEKTARRLYWNLKAVPGFKEGNRIEYSYKETLPAGSFAMTTEEMVNRGLEWEYFYVRITRPTEKLVFSVTMPPNFTPEKWDFDVWFGWRGQERHAPEYYRIVENKYWQVNRIPRTEQIRLQLHVDYPIQGLYYAIKWRPPKI